MNNDGAVRTAVVLVHGIFHGPWCWEPIVERLGAEFELEVPELPMTTLSADADTVRAAVTRLRDKGCRVLVVGHSYGGMVISAGAHGADRLLYLAAVVPDAGQTLSQVASDGPGSPRTATAAFVRNGDQVALTEVDDDVVAAFLNRTPRAQFDAIKPLFRAASMAVYAEAIAAPAWQDVPGAYISCSDDHVLDPAYQRRVAARFADSYELDADHSAFYSATEPLAEIVAGTARRLGSR